jgi:hypothetical protein
MDIGAPHYSLPSTECSNAYAIPSWTSTLIVLSRALCLTYKVTLIVPGQFRQPFFTCLEATD